MTESNLKFTATDEKGPVSALLSRPDDSHALIVLAHGAGANMLHQHMQSITSALEHQGLATLRFNFPYMEAGGKRTDSKPVCIETISGAVNLASFHALDGNEAKALRWLGVALDRGLANRELASISELESLQGHPKFEAIVAEVNRPVEDV